MNWKMKWSEMKWSEMKRDETKRNEMKWNETTWNEKCNENEMKWKMKRNETNWTKMKWKTKPNSFLLAFFFVCVFFPGRFLSPLGCCPLVYGHAQRVCSGLPNVVVAPGRFFRRCCCQTCLRAMPNVVPSARCLVSLLAVKNGFQGAPRGNRWSGGGGVEPGSKKVGWVLESLGSI